MRDIEREIEFLGKENDLIDQIFDQWVAMGRPKRVAVCYGGLALWWPEQTYTGAEFCGESGENAAAEETIVHIASNLIEDYYPMMNRNEEDVVNGHVNPSSQELVYVRPQGFHLSNCPE